MFASGSHDGTVRIWTKPPSSPDLPTEQFDYHAYPHLGEGDYFTFGDMSRSSSPPPDLQHIEQGYETPDLEYTGRVKIPKGLSVVSSHSSESSVVKMR
jgi:hypothetical protein